MLIVEERALVVDLQDRIIALLVERQEAWARGNAGLAQELTRKIDRLRVECADIRKSAGEQLRRSRS
jgi:hypothetical protein